jgi:DNA-directed RNA polymerase specialized sigma24 family protein
MSESPDDAVLLARIGKRDTNAFAVLYDRHARLAYGYAVRLVNDTLAAEALVEKVFLCLWRHADSDTMRNSTMADWLLMSIARQAHLWRATIPPPAIVAQKLASAG